MTALGTVLAFGLIALYQRSRAEQSTLPRESASSAHGPLSRAGRPEGRFRGYAELALSVPGLSEVGAAGILAETGDPARYDSGRAWAKHAGVCPRDNASGRYEGMLRTAAWRAVWPLVHHNEVFAARHRHLNRTRRPQAN